MKKTKWFFTLAWIVGSAASVAAQSIITSADQLAFSYYSAEQTDKINNSPLNGTTMKSVNKNAPVLCSKSIAINASAEKVWTVITDIDRWADWQTDITKPKLNGPLRPETTFDWKTGGAKIHSTLHTVEPYQQFGWTGKTFGVSAVHNWKLTQAGKQVIVSVDESMEGFLAGLFKKSFNKNLESGMQHWLELLKKHSEE